MIERTGWRLTLGFYWLALGTWFGALVMLAMGAAATFEVLRQFHPVLMPGIGAAPAGAIENPATVMAGSVVGRMLDHLRVLAWLCAAVLGVATLLQCTLWRRRLASDGVGQWMNTLRVALLVGAVLALSADTFYLTPRIKETRVQMNTAADLAERDAVKARFDRYHEFSVRLASMMILMLGVGALASGFALGGAKPAERHEQEQTTRG